MLHDILLQDGYSLMGTPTTPRPHIKKKNYERFTNSISKIKKEILLYKN